MDLPEGFVLEDSVDVNVGLPEGFVLEDTQTQPQAQPRQLSTLDKLKITSPFLGNAIEGGLGALKGATFGFVDEVGSAGNALIDKALGSEQSISDLYGGYKQGYENFEDNSTGTVYDLGELAGAMGTGGAGLLRSVGGNVGKRALIGALQGAGSGALYGAGATRGDKLEAAESGAKFGGVLGGAIPVAGAIAKPVADRARKLFQAGQTSSLGINATDYKKALKGAGKQEEALTGQNPIVSAFKRVRKEGLLDESMNPEIILDKLKSNSKKATSDLSEIFKQVDEVIDEPVFPEFNNAKKYIDGLAGTEKSKASEKFLNEADSLLEQLDGSLSDLQKKKVAFGNKTYSGSSEAYQKGLDRAITRDLKESVENTVNKLAKQGKLGATQEGAVKKINQKLRQNIMLEEPLLREKARLNTNDLGKLASALMSTTGLGTGASIAGALYQGDPKLALPALILQSYRNPRARLMLNELLEKGVNNLGSVPQSQLRQGLISALSGSQGE